MHVNINEKPSRNGEGFFVLLKRKLHKNFLKKEGLILVNMAAPRCTMNREVQVSDTGNDDSSNAVLDIKIFIKNKHKTH